MFATPTRRPVSMESHAMWFAEAEDPETDKRWLLVSRDLMLL